MESKFKIPKIIHYCWFGESGKPEKIMRLVETWKQMLPDYNFIEWNEKNYNIMSSCDYVIEAYHKKKWAFVSDYVRLDVLYKYGGIYLDTDVEIVKKFDDLLVSDSFISSESEYTICTAVIGAKKSCTWLKEILDLYQSKNFINTKGDIDDKPNSQFIYEYFNNKFSFESSNIELFYFDEGIIFPSDFFSPINYNTKKSNITINTYTIHYYEGDWKTPLQKKKDFILTLLTRFIGEKRREKLKKALKKK